MIVDDEPAARRALRECCAAHADLAVVGEHGDGQSALTAIRSAEPDLLFLDIQMDGLNGLEVARSLPAKPPLVVFVTAYDQYAVEAFEVQAADYLLKPFDEERFARTLERVRQRHAAGSQGPEGQRAALAEILRALAARGGGQADRRLLAEAYGRQHMLDPARVELVEADRNYVKLRVGADVYHARSTLQQAEQALQSQPVLKISRSCLVNMSHVREVSRTLRGDFILLLAGGATVTSSEGCRDRVREYLDRLRL
jgi:two-component system LytT family response regulator